MLFRSCKRKLWYDKKGIPEDFHWLGNVHTKRGSMLEDFAHEHFFESAAKTIRRVRWTLHEQHANIGCHADGIVENEGGYGHWLLETKIPQARIYYSIRSAPEPPQEAYLQATWGAMIHKTPNVVVQVWSPDVWNDAKW